MNEQRKSEGPEYIVKRAFKYDDVWMAVGKPWIPKGGRFDEQIIKGGRYVEIVEPRVVTRESRARKHKGGRRHGRRQEVRDGTTKNTPGRVDPGGLPNPQPGK